MKKTLSILTIACLWVILPIISSCNNENVENVENTKREYPEGPVFSSSEKTRTDAIQDFATRFMNAVSAEYPADEGNIMSSPLGASIFLSIIANAVDEEARQEIVDALGLPGSATIEELNETMRKIAIDLPHDVDGSVLKCANGFWYSTKSEISGNFNSVMKNYFDCEPLQLDYSNRSSYDIPNNWVNNNTKGKIGGLPGMDERAGDIPWYAANAIYFEADWDVPFKESNTHNADFHNFNGSSSKIEMMKGRQEIPVYLEDEDGVLFYLNYDNRNLNMVVYIPNDATEEALSDYSKIDLQARYSNLKGCKLLNGNTTLYFPKMDLTTGTIRLDNVIRSLGINKIYDFSDSPFSDILYHGNKAKMADFSQQVSFATHEKGMVVAVVSSSDLVTAHPSTVPEEIKVDRPFLFCINAYGLPLLYGRIVNLEEKE